MSSKLSAEIIQLAAGDYLIEPSTPKYIYRVLSVTDELGWAAVAKRLSGELHGHDYRVHAIVNRLYMGTVRVVPIDAFEAELLLLRC